MIPLFQPYIPPRHLLHDAWDRVLDSGYLAEGIEVQSFEQEFGDFIDYHRCIAVSSCTAALHLALILSGAQPGTEVISTPMTAEPTNMAVLHTGAKLIWADVDPSSGNIDWSDAISKVTDDTVAVICVHYGGIPALNYDMWEMPGYVMMIEDCAQALGATWDGWHVGILSDFAAFSFQAIKFATTGDGGMLVDGCGYGDRARRLRWFGIDRSAPRETMDISEVGYKYNMNNLTAAMGRVQLQHISPAIEKHRINARFFERQLDKIKGVEYAKYDTEANPSHWFFTLVLETQVDRDRLSRRLTEAGIANGLVHRRNDLHTVFAESRCELPGLDKFYSTMLHIPCGWWMDERDTERVIEVIRGG